MPVKSLSRTVPLIAGILFGLSSHSSTSADTISGTARVIDGDTISVGATIIRLEGLDAPDLAQTCDGPEAVRRHLDIE
ncbi:MAG: hypothetical protein AAFY56_21030 [Pseudomonadota bacterium]